MNLASPTAHRGASAYARVGIETSTQCASPHQLIAMLFEGAATAIAMARHHMAERRISAKGESISKAIDIIENGLKASLDPAAGGAAGERLVNDLSALYDYIVRKLMHANLRNDAAALDESASLLESVGSAWREIDPAASPLSSLPMAA